MSSMIQYPTLDECLDAMAFSRAVFGAGTGSIAMDEVRCTGSECRLVNCRHTTRHDCSHSEDASVRCYDPSESIGKCPQFILIRQPHFVTERQVILQV